MAQRTQGEYYSIDTERARQIAEMVGVSLEEVVEYAAADWPEGEVHQAWLDTAPIEEIAGWMRDSLKQS